MRSGKVEAHKRARALAKAGSEYAIDARVRGRDTMRHMVIAICHAWGAARREIAKGLEKAPSQA